MDAKLPSIDEYPGTALESRTIRSTIYHQYWLSTVANFHREEPGCTNV
jgi:hypothetical protein